MTFKKSKILFSGRNHHWVAWEIRWVELLLRRFIKSREFMLWLIATGGEQKEGHTRFNQTDDRSIDLEKCEQGSTVFFFHHTINMKYGMWWISIFRSFDQTKPRAPSITQKRNRKSIILISHLSHFQEFTSTTISRMWNSSTFVESTRFHSCR